MSVKRQVRSSGFKAKVALEAIKGQVTVNEIASEYDLHPNQVTQWKKQAIDQLPELFGRARGKGQTQEEELKARLYQEIGQLKVELDWLKKKCGLEYRG